MPNISTIRIDRTKNYAILSRLPGHPWPAKHAGGKFTILDVRKDSHYNTVPIVPAIQKEFPGTILLFHDDAAPVATAFGDPDYLHAYIAAEIGAQDIADGTLWCIEKLEYSGLKTIWMIEDREGKPLTVRVLGHLSEEISPGFFEVRSFNAVPMASEDFTRASIGWNLPRNVTHFGDAKKTHLLEKAIALFREQINPKLTYAYVAGPEDPLFKLAPITFKSGDEEQLRKLMRAVLDVSHQPESDEIRRMTVDSAGLQDETPVEPQATPYPLGLNADAIMAFTYTYILKPMWPEGDAYKYLGRRPRAGTRKDYMLQRAQFVIDAAVPTAHEKIAALKTLFEWVSSTTALSADEIQAAIRELQQPH